MWERRELAWLLSWYRQSELDGALLLGRMVRQADDPGIVTELTRHCADEARHAWLWQRTLARLGLQPVRILRSYQSFYAPEIVPASLLEVLALTHVFEQRVDREFTAQMADGACPEPVRRTFRALLDDEQRHLGWVARWLGTQPRGLALVERYKAVDERVYERLQSYGASLWNVPGLGEELSEVAYAEPFVG